jgi:hypothetical protein
MIAYLQVLRLLLTTAASVRVLYVLEIEGGEVRSQERGTLQREKKNPRQSEKRFQIIGRPGREKSGPPSFPGAADQFFLPS